jgi:hypothetical protein
MKSEISCGTTAARLVDILCTIPGIIPANATPLGKGDDPWGYLVGKRVPQVGHDRIRCGGAAL